MIVYLIQMYSYIVNPVQYTVSYASDKTLSHVLTVQPVCPCEGVSNKSEAGHCVDPYNHQTQNSHPYQGSSCNQKLESIESTSIIVDQLLRNFIFEVVDDCLKDRINQCRSVHYLELIGF